MIKNNMRKISCFIFGLLGSVVMPLMAQQLPDPSFEDWSGAQFKNSIQPKYWHYSNVSQLGIAEFNFAQRVEGRTGSYAMKVQDQDLEVAGIGATSPGYIALGQPWAHVSSITAISKATAGTYGGISWTGRPDTLTVWIKRTGPRTADENYNICFYSWRGTAEGKSYKAKDGSCAEVPDTYRFDEESDIRQALDANECNTVASGTQVAEGWLFERKTYENWTQVRVPIYYLNDQIPEKCNVIFSASNYPNFRANDGLYAGNTLIVDDVHLIYSSAIQKIYIGNREWKGFDGANHGVQTYALGQGATQIPEIMAYRGGGKLTNAHGTSATFQGRKLQGNEIQIQYGQVDGDPCKITVKAEDGSSESTYLIQFVSKQSNNAKLAGIEVNGSPLQGFNPLLDNYNVSLPYGTTDVPVVAASKQEDAQTVTIQQATSVNGKAVITVVAQDGTTKQVYTLNFSVAKLSDNTLKDILVNGKSLDGFSPTKSTYTVELPITTTEKPVITPVSAYADGAQTINIVENTLNVAAQSGVCRITVTAPAASTTRTYTLNYKITKSSNSRLSMIYVDGEPLAGFLPEVTSYSLVLPVGTTEMPRITWTAGDEFQQVNMTPGGVDGVTRIVVTAGNGSTTTYRLNISTEKSTNAALKAILLDGVALENFDAEQTEYTVVLPAGTKVAPTVTATAGDAYQSIRVVSGGLVAATRIIVTAGDGVTTRTYVLNFEVEKSQNAFLEMIYLDGQEIDEFDKEVFVYRHRLGEDKRAPQVTVRKMEGQRIVLSQPLSVGVARIEVVPEEGESNIYTVTFYDDTDVILPEPKTPDYQAESAAELQMIYLDGDSLKDFAAEVMEYTIELPKTATEQPLITAKAKSNKARTMIITQGEANANAVIRVIAEDSVTTKDYVLHFPYAKSSNTALEDIDANGYMTFVASQRVYSFDLPYEVEFPDVYVTQAEASQAVSIESVNCKTRHDVMITVTAEDGTVGTYEVHMTKLTHPDNVLRAVYANDFFLDSLTLNSADTLHVSLPYDATELGLTGIEKNYDDQYVVVDDGGVNKITTIWVYSGHADEVAKVYTLVPERLPSPLWLTKIMVNGVALEGFAPDRFDYIARVTDNPVVTATCEAGAMVETVDADDKHIVLKVENDDAPQYTVWFYYTNDVIPNADFSESAVAQYNNAFKPRYWQVPADGDDKYSWGLQGEVKTGPEVARNSDGSIRLETWRSKAGNSIYGSLPGMMTLGTLSLNMASTGGSTSSISGGIAYRNTPDTLLVDARPVSKRVFTGVGAKDMPNWRVLVNMDNQESLYEGQFSNLNAWRTVHLPLLHEGTVSNLNIVLNSGKSENAKDYGGYDCYTSQVDFRDVRLAYSSQLAGLTYAGATMAPDAAKHLAITVPTETTGVPTLGFVYGVADQAAEILWGKDVKGVRQATIRNYAEDGSYTDYTLTVTRSLSTDAGYTAETNALADLYIRTSSPHATASVEMLADSVVLTVTPESGAAVRKQFAAMVIDYDTVRTSISAVFPAVGKDSTSTVSNETVYSDDVTLAYIVLGTDTLSSYEPEQLSYSLYTATNAIATAGKANEQQTVTVEHHTLSDGADLYYIYVRAGNGATRLYQVVEHHTLPSTDATLSSIALNGVLLDGFQSDTYTYTVTLPAHSELPDVTAVLNSSAATLTMQNSGQVLQLIVTAEDGITTLTYTLMFNIPPSDISHLTMILLDGAPLDGFEPDTYLYDINLPAHTQYLPAISYVQAEPLETTVVDSVAIVDHEGSYTLTVTAEDAVHQSVYTLRFHVLLSDNALLADILADGETIDGFYAEMTEPMTIDVAYGQSLPVITWEKQDATQTVDTSYVGNQCLLDVTAEDGVTQHRYTIAFNMLRSDNANLLMILCDNQPLADFAPDTYEYEVLLPANSAMPEVTVQRADDQQVVDIAWDDQLCTITVTPGDGSTPSVYTIQFIVALSDNSLLSDLRVRGVTIEGFAPTTYEYTITYPWGTPDSLMVTAADVAAVAQDIQAVVSVMDKPDHVIVVQVVAADGVSVSIYEIHQLVDINLQLRMIYVDGKPLRGFDPDVYSYDYILPAGVQTLELMAEPMDTANVVSYSVIALNDVTYIFCTTPDDSQMLAYELYISNTDVDASVEPAVDDVAFVPVQGTRSFLAVSIRSGVQVAVYDYMGHMHMLSQVPVCDPNYVDVRRDENGHEYINEVYPGANGVEFEVPNVGVPFIYVFYKSTDNKRFTKGGKFMVR